ncbi:hypothetical protein BDZ89DRAFT_1062866 [Hymenopellis radicata]|nr:hypothetical protein BDZ89DRAFT_1062866 [Hymenopellis radicata]
MSPDEAIQHSPLLPLPYLSHRSLTPQWTGKKKEGHLLATVREHGEERRHAQRSPLSIDPKRNVSDIVL